MRTENPTPPDTPQARIRAQVARVMRWVGARPPGIRRALVGAALAALIVAGYLTLPSDPIGPAWIDDGRQFSPHDAERIAKTLNAKGIRATLASGRVGVPRDRLDEAQAALDKADAWPHSPKDIIDEPLKSSFLLTTDEIEWQRKRQLERFLEAAIQESDGNFSAIVFVNRSRRPGRGSSSNEVVTVRARLTTQDGRPIPLMKIEAIQGQLVALVPDLKPESVTILDSKGHVYLGNDNSSLVRRSRTRVREEELMGQIAEKLEWIEGVQVSVRLDPPPAWNPPPAPQPAVVVPNAPLGLDPETSTESHAGEAPGAGGKVRVLVQVPIGHYLLHFQANGPRREPSPDDLKPYVEKTEEIIQSAVAHVVPPDELGDVKIVRIDAPARGHSSESAVAPPSSRPSPWVMLALAVAILTGLALVAGRLLVARRPAARPVHWVRRDHLDLGEPPGPGPSERVRELVRLDPAAAAGVLQRWIGQGGHAG